tara:strand:- start:1284 stop:1511 length:228 start_codon:yes stop_codon:yes gene_type:complete
MNKELTFGNLLAILIPTFITIFIWGKNVETRLTEHSIRIQQVELTNGKVEVKLDDISDDLRTILVKLENKVDEKK